MRMLVLFAVLVPASIARADSKELTLPRSCAEVAPDGLDDAYRTRAQQLLSRTLEQANLFVVERDCTQTYRIQFADENRTIILDGPGPRVSRAVDASGDLVAEYAALIETQRRLRDTASTSVAVAEPPAPSYPTYAPTPSYPSYADDDEPASNDGPPRPVKNLFYGRLGIGGVTNVDAGNIVAFGLRHTIETADIDLSVGVVAGVTLFGKLEILKTPTANKLAPYVGGGLSLSNTFSDYHDATGLGAELTAGVTLTPSHKWSLQADLSLPFYRVGEDYPAALSMSLGYGFVGH